MTSSLSRGLAPALLLAWCSVARAADAAAPAALQLSFQAGEKLTYVESLHGRGELVRHGADGDRQLDLECSASAERAWRIGLTDEGAYSVQARSRKGHAELQMPGAGFTDERPWRSFQLAVARSGAVLHAEVLLDDESPADADQDRAKPADEPAADAGEDQGLPIDLDLGEVFTMAQLGMLPPAGVAPGGAWTVERQPGSPFSLEGQYLELRDDQGPLAVLQTKFSSPVPERDTPDPKVVVSGTVEGTLKVLFDVAAGRVRSASGPLVLKLHFKRRGSGGDTVADLALRLDLETHQAAPQGRR